MTMRFEPSVTTSQIIAGISAQLRAEQGPLDALLAQSRQPGAQVGLPSGSGDTFARLRALVGGRVTLPIPGRAAAEPRGAQLAASVPVPVPMGRRVTFRLPNNRRVRGYIAPAAHRIDFAALRGATASNTARKFAAIQQNAQAIDALARSLRELAVVVAELQAQSDPALFEGLLGSLEGLNLSLGQQAQVLANQQAALAREQSSLRESVQAQARNASISKFTATASQMQSAAFGTQGKLLSRNNLLVAANNLVFGFLGNSLGWLSPIASLAVAQVTIGRRTQPRFITGVATDFKTRAISQGSLNPEEKFGVNAVSRSLRGASLVQISLLDRIAPALRDSFRKRTDILVTASPLPPHADVEVLAAVMDGTLTIVSFSKPEGLRVTWSVDTGAPNG
jgi:hypothetical protein